MLHHKHIPIHHLTLTLLFCSHKNMNLLWFPSILHRNKSFLPFFHPIKVVTSFTIIYFPCYVFWIHKQHHFSIPVFISIHPLQTHFIFFFFLLIKIKFDAFSAKLSVFMAWHATWKMILVLWMETSALSAFLSPIGN